MADFQLIKQEIDDNVNTNGVGAITGAILNTTLNDMVDAVNQEKQDTIADLATIEAGAAAGATAYQKPSTGIPASDLASGVIPDVSGKADKVTGSTNGNLAGLDANGNLTDSGYEPHDFVDTGTFLIELGYKANKVNGATAGNFAGLDAGGNLTDSGSKAADFATAAQGTKADTAYQLPTGGIPASDLAAAVQTSLGLADTAIQDVSGKADKVVGANSGDVATLDGSGNLTDSGLSVFDFFVMVEDASTPPASMAPNNVYQYGTLAGNTTFPPLATPTEPDIANVYCWTFATPATAPTITWPVAITDWAGGSAPTINASKKYEVSVMDGLATIIEA